MKIQHSTKYDCKFFSLTSSCFIYILTALLFSLSSHYKWLNLKISIIKKKPLKGFICLFTHIFFFFLKMNKHMPKILKKDNSHKHSPFCLYTPLLHIQYLMLRIINYTCYKKKVNIFVIKMLTLLNTFMTEVQPAMEWRTLTTTWTCLLSSS